MTAETSSALRERFPQGRVWSNVLFVFFGVLVPAATLAFEISTGGCAELFFDPIPTMMHTVMVGAVPLLTAWLLFFTARGQTAVLAAARLANGFCLGFSGVYALLFLPLLPFAVPGIIFYGIGLLPLAPLFSVLVNGFLWFRLNRIEASARTTQRPLPQYLETQNLPLRRFAWIAMGAALLVLALGEVSRAVTIAGIEMADSSDPQTQTRGIELLRWAGNENLLLKQCYQEGGRPFGFYDIFEPEITVAEARRLYYRVTGTSFNDVAETPFRLLGGRSGDTWDQDLGGEHVGRRVEELTLESSRLDGAIVPRSAVGYLEWTMVFHNASTWRDQEARFILGVPPGGVISRVTLWVNGEAREAAFGTRATVRAAYENVAVQQARDPLLVTWLAPDAALVQCFPVLAGENMKIRVGVSFPLQPEEKGQAFTLPRILSQNFGSAEDFQHSIWLECPVPIALDGSSGELGARDLRAEWSGEEMARSRLTLTAQPAKNLWGEAPDGSLVAFRQQAPEAFSPADEVIAVVDGSAGNELALPRLTAWLRERRKASVYFAGDAVESTSGTGAQAAAWLARQSFVGGQDAVPALDDALAEASAREEPAEIWFFHGAQPILLSPLDRLMRYSERPTNEMALYTASLQPGANRLLEKPPLAHALPVYGEEFLPLPQSYRVEPVSAPPGGAPEAASHLEKLWVTGMIEDQLRGLYFQQARMEKSAYGQKLAELAELAARERLITFVSGAVVLETDEQYGENDLEPPDPDAPVPAVPEPAHVALATGVLCVLAVYWQRRRRRGA